MFTVLKFNPKSGRKESKLNVYERKPIPFDTVHIDHLGPIGKSKRGFDHILSVVDGFTKFERLFATKTTGSDEVIKALNAYCRAYGCPRRIVSDKGKGFDSEKFKKWCERKGIKHIMTGVACPWANGQVERYNRTIIPMLAKLKEASKKEWDVILGKCELALNNMTSSTTKESAARLLFGINLRGDDSLDIEDFMEKVNKENKIEIGDARQSANKNIRKNQEYNKKYFDRKVVKEHVFKKGDLVLIKGRKVVGNKSKLYGRFRGPYIVEEVMGNRYLVTDIPGWRVSRTSYRAILDSTRMKLYRLANEPFEVWVDDINEEDNLEWIEDELEY